MSGWGKEIVRDPALWITLIIAGLIAFWGDKDTLSTVSIQVGLAVVTVSATLLGIVLAALAIFVVFLDEKYITLVEKVYPIEQDTWPFKWVTLIAIINLTSGLILILVGDPTLIIFRTIMFITLWSFLYLLWQIFELVKFLAEHIKTRSKHLILNKNRPKK
ncbi:MAG: hypothetical protein QQM50_07605 [Dehalococcoides mccartyi]|uniref:hypothetical protein n=1 Tax=Dehalococcoides TaxID=61434 RepID=UPI00059CFEC3|nr:hypothetical protein [Dehalococcoides mccartyi]MDP4280389.1 hypothetical protein [Dehalococcoides mccartyi]